MKKSSKKKVVVFLNTRECAYLADCCPDDVLMDIRHGKLKAKKDGKLYQVRETAAKEWAKSRMEKPR